MLGLDKNRYEDVGPRGEKKLINNKREKKEDLKKYRMREEESDTMEHFS